MALRLLQAHVPPEGAEETQQLLAETAEQCWVETGGRYGAVVRAVLGARRTGAAIDRLHEVMQPKGSLLVLVQPLDGVLPRPLASYSTDARQAADTAAAVSREEVYASLVDGARLDREFLIFVVLASVLAGIGMALDNTAAVIGAMVVAPLLGPNMAFSLGLVLGDRALIRRSLQSTGVGLVLALALAALLGVAIGVDPATPELFARTQVGIWDLVLAFAAGCAGALAHSTGISAELTGVMVAVALLPPTVASGMLLTRGELADAGAALLLTIANITALTLGAMLTFRWRGLRPRNWWQEARAKRSRRVGLSILAFLFVLLAVLLALADKITS